MNMANYNISLNLSEKQVTILYDALQYYAMMNEEIVEQYSNADVAELFEEISNLYLEEDTEYQLDPAAKSFMEQYGREELLKNSDRWKGFKKAYDLLHESNGYECLSQELDM